MRSLSILLTFFAAFTVTLSLPLPSWLTTRLTLPTTTRAFQLSQIDGTYTSVFRFSPECPNTITYSNTRIIQQGQLAVTNFPDISINGSPCQGDGSQKAVTEIVARRAPQLAALGLTQFIDALAGNAAATNVLSGGVNQTEVVVGYDASVRNCGAGGTWPADTFYFFIQEPRGFNITIGTTANRATTTIKGNEKGVFIVENIQTTGGRRPRLCILTSPLAGGAAEMSPEAEMSPDAEGTGMPTAGGVGAVTGDGDTDGQATPEATDGTGSGAIGGGTGTGTGGDGDDTDASPTATADQGLGADDGVEESPTESPDEDDEDDGAICFPENGVVEMQDGNTKLMKEVQIGDKVKTAAGVYSEVFMFTHRHSDIKHNFVQLETKSGASIRMTPGHYMHVGKYGKSKLVQARYVKLGDTVTLGKNNEGTTIIAKKVVTSKGLYNPQTLDGSIVVDGVRASTYTAAVHPWLAHNILLAPIRWAYQKGIMQKPFEGVFEKNNDRWAAMVLSGPKEML